MEFLSIKLKGILNFNLFSWFTDQYGSSFTHNLESVITVMPITPLRVCHYRYYTYFNP